MCVGYYRIVAGKQYHITIIFICSRDVDSCIMVVRAACWPGLERGARCLRRPKCEDAQCVCAVYNPSDICKIW
jgi:hypothetical protein